MEGFTSQNNRIRNSTSEKRSTLSSASQDKETEPGDQTAPLPQPSGPQLPVSPMSPLQWPKPQLQEGGMKLEMEALSFWVTGKRALDSDS